MYCSKCGAEILDDSLFCKKCGHKIEQTDNKNLNENNEEQDKIYTEQSKIEKEQKNKVKFSKKRKTIIWIICSILLAVILLTIYIINDIHQTNEQEHLKELRSNIIKQYNVLGISKSVEEYMNLSEKELQEELDKVSKQVQEFIDLNTKYEDIIAKVDCINYQFKLGDMGYQKINYNTGDSVVVIPKQIVKTDKIFHINTVTEKVDTIWCLVEFSYEYTDGIKLKTGTNTQFGNLKIDVETENVTVYSPLDFENGIVTYADLFMPAENHIIAVKNTARNNVIYPYKFFSRENAQIVFGEQVSKNNQLNNEISEDYNTNDEINLDDNTNNTSANDNISSDNNYYNNNTSDNIPSDNDYYNNTNDNISSSNNSYNNEGSDSVSSDSNYNNDFSSNSQNNASSSSNNNDNNNSSSANNYNDENNIENEKNEQIKTLENEIERQKQSKEYYLEEINEKIERWDNDIEKWNIMLPDLEKALEMNENGYNEENIVLPNITIRNNKAEIEFEIQNTRYKIGNGQSIKELYEKEKEQKLADYDNEIARLQGELDKLK